MTLQISHKESEEIHFIQRGKTSTGIFFGLMGVLFEILFFWGLWSFLNNSGRWADFFLLVINSDIFPFTSLLFLFGAGCFLMFFKEMWWIESLSIRKNVAFSKPGIQKDWRFLRWAGRSLKIYKDDILTLRVHSISLNKFSLYKLRQIEIDYQSPEKNSFNTVVLYREQEADSTISINKLIHDIQEILEISQEIEYTESSTTENNSTVKSNF